MRKIIMILILGWSAILLYGQDPIHTYHFFLHDNYVTQSSLYHTLFNEVGDSDELFLWCCDCI